MKILQVILLVQVGLRRKSNFLKKEGPIYSKQKTTTFKVVHLDEKVSFTVV